MSIYSNVTEQDLINLRKLAQQRKEQRALKIKNRILIKTHDKKLAESLSPITKRLDLVENKKGEKIGDLIKKSESPAIENIQTQPQTPQPAIENTQNALPIENEQVQPGVIYDTSLENTLHNMKDNIGFFNIEERDNGDIFWNGISVEKMGGKKLKINEKIYEITPGIQKVFTDKTNIPIKKLNDIDRENLINILESLGFGNYKPIRG